MILHPTFPPWKSGKDVKVHMNSGRRVPMAVNKSAIERCRMKKYIRVTLPLKMQGKKRKKKGKIQKIRYWFLSRNVDRKDFVHIINFQFPLCLTYFAWIYLLLSSGILYCSISSQERRFLLALHLLKGLRALSNRVALSAFSEAPIPPIFKLILFWKFWTSILRLGRRPNNESQLDY